MFCASLDGEPVIVVVRTDLMDAKHSMEGSCCLHGQDASTTSNIKDNLVFEQVLVLDNGVHVGSGSDFVFL